ncbi:MAG: hypothetical protein IKG77_10325 [Prevotella sp.]|nr:hypothetical protein [Prevotella sp.]
MLELNDVLLRGEHSTLSMMAHEGQVTCITRVGAPLGATPVGWLHAMMGFVPVVAGYISIDGEPLTVRSAAVMRRLMAFVPAALEQDGEVEVYEPPSVQDVFALKANRQFSISNGLLSEEMKRTGTTGMKAQLLAVGVLLQRYILLVDRPAASSMPYLKRQAEMGRIVVVTSNDSLVVSQADCLVEIKE